MFQIILTLSGQLVISMIPMLDPFVVDNSFAVLHHQLFDPLEEPHIAQFFVCLEHNLFLKIQHARDFMRIIHPVNFMVV